VGIPYRLVDLTNEVNEGARTFISDDLGYTEAPVVILDDDPEHHWSGFRPDLIDALAFQIRRVAEDRVPIRCTSPSKEASNVQR
jgi:glutaredoxin-like protein NrdH